MAQADVTPSEMMQSITGFEDRDLLLPRFGGNAYALSQGDPVVFGRALMCVHLTRNGEPATKAYTEAMNAPMREVFGYFEDEPDEAVPDDPETPAGKDS